MKKQSILLFLHLILSVVSYTQQGKIYTLRNCQGEMRALTFQHQVNIIWKCVAAWTTIRQQRVLNFSPEYKVDTTFFESQIEKIKKVLPSDFFKNLNYLGDGYNNIPDEQLIWFTQIYAQRDKQGNYKVYAAVKIKFDGTDARIDHQRRNPQIIDLTFIFDRTELDKLGQKLKTSPKAG